MREKIAIQNKNNLSLAAVVHVPELPCAGTFPAMILLHGFTGDKEERHIVSLADALAYQGVLAIRFDASGFGESGGTLEDDFRLSHYIADTDAVVQYATSRKDVDAARVGVWGHSMGGIVAVAAAAAHADIKLVCIISAPPMMGASDKLGKALPEWKRTGYYARESPHYGRLQIPYAFLEDAQIWDVFTLLLRVRVPKLVVWGTKDVNVLPQQTKAIFEKSMPPKEGVEIEGMDHYYKNNPEVLEKVNTATIAFVMKNFDA